LEEFAAFFEMDCDVMAANSAPYCPTLMFKLAISPEGFTLALSAEKTFINRVSATTWNNLQQFPTYPTISNFT
jgi:hypothetical protein